MMRPKSEEKTLVLDATVDPTPERKHLAEWVSRLETAKATLEALQRALEWDGAASVAIRTARARVEEAEAEGFMRRPFSLTSIWASG
jgi:hypothetical protein